MVMSYNVLTEITLKMIIESGVMKPDTIIYSDSEPVICGKINDQGLIVLTIENEIKIFPYPSGAARAIINLSVNGWKFWKVKFGDEMKELSYYRELFKQQIIK